MTEEEAKTKWCPMKKFVPLSPGQETYTTSSPNWKEESEKYFNTLYESRASGANCIGSACMMWRISPQEFTEKIADAKILADGYCGLAGKL